VETFSLAALEAMALGKPVVLSDIGGAAEMIRPGESGFLFPVGDTGALVDCLARLVDHGERERMGRQARARVEALFSEKTMVDRYEELLLNLQPVAAAQERQPIGNCGETRVR
jgi:glycosyltransferase involved in cell wall biosynthesis